MIEMPITEAITDIPLGATEEAFAGYQFNQWALSTDPILASASIEDILATFYAKGRFWVFWCIYNNNGLRCLSSTDGVTWTENQNLEPSQVQREVCVTPSPDRNYVYWANTRATPSGSDQYMRYRRGTLNGDGTVTDITSWQYVIGPASGQQADYPRLVWDKDNYLYPVFWKMAPSWSSHVRVYKNSNQFPNDETWSLDPSYPISLNSNTGVNKHRLRAAKIPSGGIRVIWFKDPGYEKHTKTVINDVAGSLEEIWPNLGNVWVDPDGWKHGHGEVIHAFGGTFHATGRRSSVQRQHDYLPPSWGNEEELTNAASDRIAYCTFKVSELDEIWLLASIGTSAPYDLVYRRRQSGVWEGGWTSFYTQSNPDILELNFGIVADTEPQLRAGKLVVSAAWHSFATGGTPNRSIHHGYFEFEKIAV